MNKLKNISKKINDNKYLNSTNSEALVEVTIIVIATVVYYVLTHFN